jgi:hypothetical protein
MQNRSGRLVAKMNKPSLLGGLVIVTVGLMCCTIINVAIADEEAGPNEYRVVTADKRHVFVMLMPEYSRQWSEALGGHPHLHKIYPKSGLYLADGSKTPLWTVDWYGGVELSLDGRYLVRWGPWAPARDLKYTTLAVAFYKDGVKLRSYAVRNLVSNPTKLPYSSDHYQWLHSIIFNPRTNRLAIKTFRGRSPDDEYAERPGTQLTFDITTGKIIRKVILPNTVKSKKRRH